MGPVLVLAANSFVGRHLCERLTADHVPVHAATRSGHADALRCDLTVNTQVDALIAAVRPSSIFNCAGATASSSPDEMRRLHIDGTTHLLDAIRRRAPEATTILFGSAAEYGPVAASLLPIREETPANPGSTYGRSKLEQTRLAEGMAAEHGLRIHVVRPFNLLGPGLGPQYFVSALCERLRKSQPGEMPIANARATRDWVDVRDVVDAIVRLAQRPPAPGRVEIYNIATGRETSVLEVADFLCRLAGNFVAVDGGDRGGRSDIDRSCGDATRLRTATGWSPRISWQHSVTEMWRAT
jgi:GDP-4-dehydro-6-deoxy-D-mannose reductase